MEVSHTIELTNLYGLHARSSSLLAQTAQQFKASIRLGRLGNNDEVDAKSILALLTLGASKGQALLIRASGEDAEKAVAALTELIGKNFGAE